MSTKTEIKSHSQTKLNLKSKFPQSGTHPSSDIHSHLKSKPRPKTNHKSHFISKNPLSISLNKTHRPNYNPHFKNPRNNHKVHNLSVDTYDHIALLNKKFYQTMNLKNNAKERRCNSKPNSTFTNFNNSMNDVNNVNKTMYHKKSQKKLPSFSSKTGYGAMFIKVNFNKKKNDDANFSKILANTYGVNSARNNDFKKLNQDLPRKPSIYTQQKLFPNKIVINCGKEENNNTNNSNKDNNSNNNNNNCGNTEGLNNTFITSNIKYRKLNNSNSTGNIGSYTSVNNKKIDSINMIHKVDCNFNNINNSSYSHTKIKYNFKKKKYNNDYYNINRLPSLHGVRGEYYKRSESTGHNGNNNNNNFSNVEETKIKANTTFNNNNSKDIDKNVNNNSNSNINNNVIYNYNDNNSSFAQKKLVKNNLIKRINNLKNKNFELPNSPKRNAQKNDYFSKLNPYSMGNFNNHNDSRSPILLRSSLLNNYRKDRIRGKSIESSEKDNGDNDVSEVRNRTSGVGMINNSSRSKIYQSDLLSRDNIALNNPYNPHNQLNKTNTFYDKNTNASKDPFETSTQNISTANKSIERTHSSGFFKSFINFMNGNHTNFDFNCNDIFNEYKSNDPTKNTIIPKVKLNKMKERQGFNKNFQFNHNNLMDIISNNNKKNQGDYSLALNDGTNDDKKEENKQNLQNQFGQMNTFNPNQTVNVLNDLRKKPIIKTKDSIDGKNKENNNKEKEEKIKNTFSPKSLNQTHKKIKKIYTFTHVGFDGIKEKKNNQDTSTIMESFAGNSEYIYMAVFDGHGVLGHIVSSTVRDILPKSLSSHLIKSNILSNIPSEKQKMHSIIIGTFLQINEKINQSQSIDTSMSGTTCAGVIYTPTKLICQNLGDSRVVVGKHNPLKNTWSSRELTRDHKPTEPDEAKRIISSNGRINSLIDNKGKEIGPKRIWLKEENLPGLSMTRSFGDKIAQKVGVMAIPEISEYDLFDDDKFVIIASDGVWEFMTSDECVNFVKYYYNNNDMEGGCEFLYQECRNRWMKNEGVVDDITIVLAFFD